MFEYEFRIFGLRRSGNHSLVSLICSQFPDNSVYYYNDIQYPEYLFSHPSYRTSKCQRPLHSGDHEIMGEIVKKLVDKEEYKLSELVKKKDRLCLILSYEDKDLKTIMERIKINEKQREKSNRVFNIIVVRDYRNWVASRLKAWEKTGYKNDFLKIYSGIIDLWGEYMNEIEGKTEYLKEDGVEKVVYHFNRMITKPKCRVKILKELRLFEKKKSWQKMEINSTINCGKGSSFIGEKMEENSKNYNERWREMNHHRIYQECMKYKDGFYIGVSDRVFRGVKKSVESSSQISSF